MPRVRSLRSLPLALAAILIFSLLLAPPARADAIADAKALAAPGVPGANDWSCRPRAAHPRPVVLVHGTFANGSVNWPVAAPALASRGHCVFALTYGAVPGVPVLRAIAPVADSAAQLATFVNGVLAATGASEVNIVGHSQGGMMPRYYVKFLGGAAKVHTLVGLAPSNHGTTLSGLATLAAAWPGALDIVAGACPACADQVVGSPLLTRLNAGGDTVAGVDYTVIATRYDGIVTPYRSQFLSGPNVRNVTLQDLCAFDLSEHALIAFDRIALHEVLNTLDPANAIPTNCFSHV
ncbi:esterase/lipase family protein [Actinomadura alba]|uniref:Alpha/beta fold hydrolase n=1 Tax=Actinomadura alba TaxID=406431 RepID=A0ABR7LGW7_9ACTN|nr:alpha/beta fold hydrolase [Actinomadura alba]MBC6464075.1 alpha/beta fold hydrolase [Actinomadura alba]